MSVLRKIYLDCVLIVSTPPLRVYTTSTCLHHLYMSTNSTCLPTPTCLLYIHMSTPSLRVYNSFTYVISFYHLYVSTPPLRVYTTSTCLHHLYMSTNSTCLPTPTCLLYIHMSTPSLKNSREKWRKWISLTGSPCWPSASANHRQTG